VLVLPIKNLYLLRIIRTVSWHLTDFWLEIVESHLQPSDLLQHQINGREIIQQNREGTKKILPDQHLIENKFDRKRIFVNPNPKAQECFWNYEMTSFFEQLYRYRPCHHISASLW